MLDEVLGSSVEFLVFTPTIHVAVDLTGPPAQQAQLCRRASHRRIVVPVVFAWQTLERASVHAFGLAATAVQDAGFPA